MASVTDKHFVFNMNSSVEEVSKIFDSCEDHDDIVYLLNLNSGGLDLLSMSASDGNYKLVSMLVNHPKTNKLIKFSNFNNFSIRWAIENNDLEVIKVYLSESSEFKDISKDIFDYFVYYCLKKQSFAALDLFLEKYKNIENKQVENLASKENIYQLIAEFNYLDIIKKFEMEKYFNNEDLNKLLINSVLKSNINLIKNLIFDFNVEFDKSTIVQINLINSQLTKNILDYLEIKKIGENSDKTRDIKIKI